MACDSPPQAVWRPVHAACTLTEPHRSIYPPAPPPRGATATLARRRGARAAWCMCPPKSTSWAASTSTTQTWSGATTRWRPTARASLRRWAGRGRLGRGQACKQGARHGWTCGGCGARPLYSVQPPTHPSSPSLHQAPPRNPCPAASRRAGAVCLGAAAAHRRQACVGGAAPGGGHDRRGSQPARPAAARLPHAAAGHPAHTAARWAGWAGGVQARRRGPARHVHICCLFVAPDASSLLPDNAAHQPAAVASSPGGSACHPFAFSLQPGRCPAHGPLPLAGARCSVYCATSPDLDAPKLQGCYYLDSNCAPIPPSRRAGGVRAALPPSAPAAQHLQRLPMCWWCAAGSELQHASGVANANAYSKRTLIAVRLPGSLQGGAG